MVPEQIERETVIAAPVERVWALLTEAEHLGRWFGDAGAELDLRPGGALSLTWERVRHRPRARRRRRRAAAASAIAGPSCASRSSEPVEGNSTLVEFTLEAEGDGTRLRVVESGFDTLFADPAKQDERAEDNRKGWAQRARRAERVRRARHRLNAPMERRRADEVMAALADPTRWRVLSLLAERGEGDRHDAGRRAAGQPRGGRQAPGGPRPRRPGRGRRHGREVRYRVRPERLEADGALDGRARLAVGPAPGRPQAPRRGGAPAGPLA